MYLPQDQQVLVCLKPEPPLVIADCASALLYRVNISKLFVFQRPFRVVTGWHVVCHVFLFLRYKHIIQNININRDKQPEASLRV